MQDNAPATPLAMAAVTKYIFEVLPHTLYSPDLALSDFYLFPNLKTNPQGRNIGSIEGVIDAVDEYLVDQVVGFCFQG